MNEKEVFIRDWFWQEIENNPKTPEIYLVSSWENEYDDSIYPTYVK